MDILDTYLELTDEEKNLVRRMTEMAKRIAPSHGLPRSEVNGLIMYLAKNLPATAPDRVIRDRLTTATMQSRAAPSLPNPVPIYERRNR